MRSRVPTAMAALTTALRGAGLPVLGGPTVTGSPLTKVVTVGFTSADDTTTVEAAAVLEGLGVEPNREQFTIRCFASVASGSASDMDAVLDGVYDLLAGVGDAIARDATLMGEVLFAYISEHTLRQRQDSSGAIASISFGVTCDAYTTK